MYQFVWQDFTPVLWHCWLDDRKGIWPVKSWVLVCCLRFDWNFARLFTAPVATTTSIILSSYKIQNGNILVPANPGPPGRMAVKTERVYVTRSVHKGTRALCAQRIVRTGTSQITNKDDEWVSKFNVCISTLQVILMISLSSQSFALILTIKHRKTKRQKMRTQNTTQHNHRGPSKQHKTHSKEAQNKR